MYSTPQNIRKSLYRYTLVGIVILIILAAIVFYQVRLPSREVGGEFSINTPIPPKLSDKAVLDYLEATSIIQHRALFLHNTDTRETLFKDMIRSYLKLKDGYSQYLTVDEFQKYKEYHEDTYVGLGMELEKSKNGDILCYPYPGSAAQEAGIKPGHRLLKVNGEDVRNKSLFSVALMVRGKIGTKLTLVISTAEGNIKETVAHLSKNELKTVTMSRQDNMPIIRILFFSTKTKMKLIEMLSNLAHESVIILDLRNNHGGDFHAAIDSADLFVPPGKILASTIQRNGQNTYKSSNAGKYLQPRILIWQDQGTASAAEVFIAALTENDRATSIGVQSFGKGEMQDIIELSNGSALILTTGYLVTPTGVKYHESGLEPLYVIDSAILNTSDYMKKVRELH